MKPTDKQLRCILTKPPGKLTSEDLSWLSPRYVERLSQRHVARLTPAQIGRLTVDQVAALTQDQVAVLSLEQMGLVPSAPRRQKPPEAGKTVELPPLRLQRWLCIAYASLIPAIGLIRWITRLFN